MNITKIFRLAMICLGFSISTLNAQEFYLYNHAKLKEGIKPDNQLPTDYIQEHLSEIMPNVPDIVPGEKYPLSSEIAARLTDLVVGQETIIIGKDDVHIDKVRTIDLVRLENNGEFLITFNFKQDYDGVYFFPPNRLKDAGMPRNVSGTKFSLRGENDLAELTARFLLNYSTRSYLSKTIINDWSGDILSELKRDFTSESFGNVVFSISQYRPLPETGKVDFIMARFGKTEFILFPGTFINIFQLNKQYYILEEGYTPGTGAAGRILYVLKGDKLVEVSSNYSYSD